MIPRRSLLALAALSLHVLIISAAAKPAAEVQASVAPSQDELPPDALWLENLDLKHMKGTANMGKTVERKPLTLNGIEYARGIGCGDFSALRVDLKRAATRFETDFNVDDAAVRRGTARAYIFVDGKLVYQSPARAYSKIPREPYRISVDLTDASDLILVGMAEERRGIFCDWAGARLLLKPEVRELPTSAPLPDELDRAASSQANPLWLDHIYHAFYTSGDAWVRFGRTPHDTPIVLSGNSYSSGVVVRPRSYLRVDLKGTATEFHSRVGVNDGSPGSVEFRVTVDNKVAYDSGPVRAGEPLKDINIDLRGARELELMVDGVPGDPHSRDACAVWTSGRIDVREVARDEDYPEPRLPAQVPMPIATIEDGPEPAIHGPLVAGASPKRPMFFRVPASGASPLTFAAEGLPAGLKIDPSTGIITGTMAAPLKKLITVHVDNAFGQASRHLTIVCAPYAMALTPPLGWNSWHEYGMDVDENKIRATADAMVSKGFAAHGFVYVNIDDGWAGPRRPDGTITLADNKFNDMKALGDYIHAKGLKFGIYSSPGPTTCGGCPGSYQHEAQDANTWASWGIDYLKHDGCSGNGLPNLGERWRLMRRCLDATGRDMVYSTNTTRDPSAHAQLWRTTADIRNRWQFVNEFGFIRSIGSEGNAGPGRYNDPDMLVVGHPYAITVRGNDSLANTLSLTRNEQITHITQWSMLAAPLLLGCDLTQADEFLVSLMCNDDVLAINQDPLVKQGWRLRQDPPVGGGGGEVWIRPLFDGTTAVAFYNRYAKPIRVKVSWDEIGRTGPQPVRDCWLRKDLGSIADGYEARVETHAAVLIRVGTPTTDRFWPE